MYSSEWAKLDEKLEWSGMRGPVIVQCSHWHATSSCVRKAPTGETYNNNNIIKVQSEIINAITDNWCGCSYVRRCVQYDLSSHAGFCEEAATLELKFVLSLCTWFLPRIPAFIRRKKQQIKATSIAGVLPYIWRYSTMWRPEGAWFIDRHLRLHAITPFYTQEPAYHGKYRVCLGWQPANIVICLTCWNARWRGAFTRVDRHPAFDSSSLPSRPCFILRVFGCRCCYCLPDRCKLRQNRMNRKFIAHCRLIDCCVVYVRHLTLAITINPSLFLLCSLLLGIEVRYYLECGGEIYRKCHF